jgi:hypothetical protein
MTPQAMTHRTGQTTTGMNAQTTADSGPGAFVRLVAFLH